MGLAYPDPLTGANRLSSTLADVSILAISSRNSGSFSRSADIWASQLPPTLWLQRVPLLVPFGHVTYAIVSALLASGQIKTPLNPLTVCKGRRAITSAFVVPPSFAALLQGQPLRVQLYPCPITGATGRVLLSHMRLFIELHAQFLLAAQRFYSRSANIWAFHLPPILCMQRVPLLVPSRPFVISLSLVNL